MSPVLIAFILFLTLSAAFLFSGMETGMLAINPLILHRKAREGKRSAQKLLYYLKKPEMFLWTNLVGGTTANFISACILTKITHQHFWKNNPELFIGCLILCMIGLFALVDLLPKIIFHRKPIFFCSVTLPFFRVAYVLLYPLISAAIKLVAMIFWHSKEPYYQRMLSNRAELRRLMENSDPDITAEERFMISNVMDFFDKTVRDLLIAMENVNCLPAATTLAEAKAFSCKNNSTHIPICEFNSKGKRHTLGILSIKMALLLDESKNECPVTDFIQPPVTVGSDLHLKEALRKLQKTGQRMAVVIDGNGTELGIITLRDVLGAVFGQTNL
ncbi:MAG: DUF21 domain-containing protein [Verrucomicrobia bacterium]|nr:DUF21 domain-containing protein [Verrucomicrobiota bacterium]